MPQTTIPLRVLRTPFVSACTISRVGRTPFFMASHNPLHQQNSSSSTTPARSLSTFRYEPLGDSQCIRILTLEPGSGSDPLVGHLRVESIDPAAQQQQQQGGEDAPPPPPSSSYEAISYVWGTAVRCSELVCDGAALPLTQSIHDALARVRHPSEPRRLWADQICINQEDVAERSQQVKLMNAVYQNAKRVLVWLGRDTDGVAADAVRMVHRLHGVFNDEEAHKAFRVEHSENLAKQSAEPWIPLAKLTKLPWFHRIWIVQEIGTPAPATLYWGDAEMDWDMLSCVAGVLNQSYHHLRSRFYIGTSNIRYLHRRFVEPAVRYDQYHNRGSFVYELHRARHLLAQDPRDRVYAFLGHFSIGIGSKALAGLVADYTRSVEEVYIDVAVRDLKDADSLIMLSANHNSRQDSNRLFQVGAQLDLPSWVPDWRVLPLHLFGSPEAPHRAAGDTKPQLTIDEASRILYSRGFQIDVIDRHSWPISGKAFQFPKYHPSQAQSQNNKNNHNHTHNHSNQQRQLHQDHQPQTQQQQQRLRPIEVIWRHLLGYQAFTLSHIYPPFGNGVTTTTSDHHKSAFFALIQTLTNGCIGYDRSRTYSAISPAEFLAAGAAYIARSAFSSPSDNNPNTNNSNDDNNSFSNKGKNSINRSNNNHNNTRSGTNNTLTRVGISPELRHLARAGDAFKWSHEATLVTRYRRFAVTSRGYYILGPDILERGDVVVVLHGGRAPFLFRRAPSSSSSPGEWFLVGECYVHGLMDGEALKMEGLKEETFSIR